jgi:hypothetical protein
MYLQKKKKRYIEWRRIGKIVLYLSFSEFDGWRYGPQLFFYFVKKDKKI